MRISTRSREYREGWTGRKRWYICRVCGKKFQHDGGQLPAQSRICLTCRPEHREIFDGGFEK